MEKHLFLGDEAIAQAAIDAGLSGVYAYPGTPSTEIFKALRWRRRGTFIVNGARMRRQPWRLLWE